MRLKTVILILIFSMLAIVVLLLIKQKLPFGLRNSSFSTPPGKEITDIELSDGQSSLSLRVKDGIWLVNGKNEARRSSIDFIISVLTRMELKSPVSPELFKKEIDDKRVGPIKVKVSGEGRTLSSFFVYKTLSNSYGNIMKLREDAKPFIIWIPGHEVEIGSIFTLNALFWQPYTAFNLLPSEISSVTVENRTDPESSFTIKNSGHLLKLSGSEGELSGWDTLLLRRYLSYFTFVPFESWALELSEEETVEIESEDPLFRISIDKSDGGITRMLLWERKSKEDGKSGIDTDRLWARLDDNTTLCLIRYVDIDPLLKKRAYFFGP